ncbi:MAG: CBS domain-containing protein [Thermodesulfobacteriota bacterium]
MMSAPPITVTVETTIHRAWEVLLNFNINAMPVVEGGKIMGVITRQVVSKAIFHKLGSAQVRDYMTIDFESVTPETSIEKIREKVFMHGQRLLPVCSAQKVAGVITRTDLLKLLQEELIEKPSLSERVVKDRLLKNVMRERLPDKIYHLLEEAGRVAESMGFKAYAVGGFVRDLVLRRDNLDIDIVIEGDGIEFAKKFALTTGARVRSHSRFKTAVMVLPDGAHVDVASTRLEYYDRPGALPTVELSSLKLDLYRRDFTVNTLALDLTPSKFGTLMDFFGALGDIKEKTVRAMHNLSFVEDPIRILRAVRFSERFAFKIAPQTLNHMKNTIKLDIFNGVSGARLALELKNILEEDIVIEAVSKLHSLGVLSQIQPKIKWDAEMAALFSRARDTLAWYRLLYTDEQVRVWLVLFLALTDSLKEGELKKLAVRLNITGKKELAIIEGRRAGLKALKRIERKPGPAPSAVYHLLKPLPVEVILYLMEKTKD